MGDNTARKTIGRESSAERIESLNDERDRKALAEALDDSPLNGRERAMQMDIIALRRQLDVERARNAVLAMGGKGTTPIGDTAERLTEVERRVLATADMTEAAKVKHLDELRGDMEKHKAQREAWLAEVEGNVSRRVEAKDALERNRKLIIP